ncbi:MAG: RNA 2',3'-cyclic phosphodiesterase [Candidatus Woesearchaeota archaeon]
MRAFIAIPIPEEVKDNILKLQKVLDKNTFRLTKKEKLHITIAFLGEIKEEKIIQIKNELDKIKFNKFILKTKGFGFFPSETKIRVVWVGLEENKEFLKLQHDIRKIFNFKEKLMPHITIARARNIFFDKDKSLKNKLYNIFIKEDMFKVDKFILYKSTFDGEEHIYKEIYTFNALN